MEGGRLRYMAPEVRDFGSLDEITGGADVLGIAPAQDMAFSGPGGFTPDGTVSEGGDVLTGDGGGGAGGGGPGGGSGSGGGSAGGASGSGGGAGGGELPFTGFAAHAAAALGSAMAATGAYMRRRFRR